MDNASANCKDSKEAYELAFSPSLRDMNRMIRKYCEGCPIAGQCMVEAIKYDAYGVWGGTTKEFRSNLKFAKHYLV